MRTVHRLALVVGLGALVAGCETFDPYVISTDTLVSGDVASIRVDVMETFDGQRYDQFRASNYGSAPICAQVVFAGSFTAGGAYSMGGVHKVAPGGTLDIGYVYYPARYRVEGRTWGTRADGGCGSFAQAR